LSCSSRGPKSPSAFFGALSSPRPVHLRPWVRRGDKPWVKCPWRTRTEHLSLSRSLPPTHPWCASACVCLGLHARACVCAGSCVSNYVYRRFLPDCPSSNLTSGPSSSGASRLTWGIVQALRAAAAAAASALAASVAAGASTGASFEKSWEQRTPRRANLLVNLNAHRLFPTRFSIHLNQHLNSSPPLSLRKSERT
jgi:hypothetical protein